MKTKIIAGVVGAALFYSGLAIGTSVAPSPAQEQVAVRHASVPTRDEILVKMNEKRLASGAEPLFYEPSLQGFVDSRLPQVRKAWEDSKECSHAGYLSSGISDSTGLTTSENLACGAYTAEAAMNSWWASPTHKFAMLNPSSTHVTIGIDRDIIVVLFSNKP